MEEILHNHFLADTYPPREHMLRDLGLEVVTIGTDSATIRMQVVPGVCSEQGILHVGLLATLVDVLGGAIAIPSVSPDWISTSNLSIKPEFVLWIAQQVSLFLRWTIIFATASVLSRVV